jgi:predicted patatin/cPLA2 family phospholipase
MSKKYKLAIVLSGGGMRCSYGAGILEALADNHQIKAPEIMIAGSGSSGTAAYFVSGQYSSLSNIWKNRLCNKKFLDKKRISRIIDIDYLVDVVFKKQEPLDTEKIKNSKIDFYIPAINLSNGQLRYFKNDENVDIFKIIKASKAMPVYYGKKIIIEGESYSDCQLSSDVEQNVKKAAELGATHILVIKSNNPGFVTRIGYKVWLNTRSKLFQKNYFEQQNEVKKIPKNLKVLILQPNESLKIGGLDNSHELLCEAVDLGYNDCIRNKELKIFLNDYKGTLNE